ncbi:LOW QUALITY PROTEIN: hypothetical protein PanWU01x14_295990 [Parasponia andersonii]|uniref:Uncharacterized protein n=1 Tax=Parasponia andersonii TaxID=3476 RepID=A0A2P5AVJ3_PARAD|nr:LOW QUALITY PROTEIN: hypothetical protein PanWU01x14_295990 [Parasponia andersonii]
MVALPAAVSSAVATAGEVSGLSAKLSGGTAGAEMAGEEATEFRGLVTEASQEVSSGNTAGHQWRKKLDCSLSLSLSLSLSKRLCLENGFSCFNCFLFFKIFGCEWSWRGREGSYIGKFFDWGCFGNFG